MTELTEEQWQRVRRHFGDLAYEHPELHTVMLELLDANDLDGALEKATRSMRADFAEGLAARLGLSELDRGDSVAVEETIAKAKAILDRVPAVSPDPGDELE
ncbi:hypothetical protein [Agrobacterium salinitolerans]|uniref:hypothetical protein n=1 Tax=Agrobacterium salinitolerans TaxID=1183413 RepID=UPI0022B853F4|nr:hypothetical protein [Agrobacterium salinitolerans]MCZ7885394.1 hypothetical protein [Agrobacterium salinitolerans]